MRGGVSLTGRSGVRRTFVEHDVDAFAVYPRVGAAVAGVGVVFDAGGRAWGAGLSEAGSAAVAGSHRRFSGFALAASLGSDGAAGVDRRVCRFRVHRVAGLATAAACDNRFKGTSAVAHP